ncbi:hypothetical protein GQX73_g8441 [Xylaria multiplex]|uniref:Methyltransferase domain-containing protein n=1 Tax=Xylaria multiplex TaxID=323545 RepID=A0A7C8MLB2_9PEZI|nr:hypothetical protein GQX73_g8441 [Xylaria multiplex]
MANIVQKEYNSEATSYDTYYTEESPMARFDLEIFISALGLVPGAVILDLGGGSGIKARLALDAGAAAVDVVDISEGMMREGEATEKKLNRDAIRWFEADISKPLDHLPLHPQYDIVMANWPLDHASNMAMLESMFQNISDYLKAGGRFLGIRTCDPRAPAMTTGELGVVYKDFEEIPGGLKYRYTFGSSIPIEAASMEATYSGSTEIYEKYGLVDVQIEPYENAQTVRDNPEVWEAFLKQPGVAMVKALKA